MAIEWDATGTKNWIGTSTSWTHTVTSGGGDRILVVSFGIQGIDVSAVTFNGEDLTRLHELWYSPIRTSLWYIVNPAVGAHTVACTSPNTRCAAVSNTYTGVDTGAPFGTYATDNTASGTGSVSADVTAQEGWLVIDSIADQSDSAIGTAGALQTKRGEIRQGGASGATTAIAHMTEEAGDSTVTMSYTFADGWSDGVMIAVPLKPKPAGIDRLARYYSNSHDPRGRIYDLYSGRDVPRSQIEVDNWLRNEGPFLLTPNKPETLIEMKSTWYIEGLSFDDKGRVSMDTESESMLDSLMRRLGGRAA